VISPTHRPLPDNRKQSKETDSHEPGRIRARNPGSPLAADPPIRPRGHCGRHLEELSKKN